jgi:phosphoribosylamine--glycine ligase
MSKSQKRNILIIGGGGREHAMGWKLAQSKRCGQLYFAPGNAGTAELGKNVDLPITPVDTRCADQIDYFCRQKQVGLIVIGPEDPLAQGLVDRLHETTYARQGGLVFGPSQAAAQLESDKAYAKQLMRACAIPTAEYKSFTDYEAAVSYVENRETPVVVKAAGLAKGKGAIVCDDAHQASDAVRRCMRDREFGEAGDTVVIEERLVGQEVSIMAMVDGRHIYVLDAAQDHKQVGEGDTGANTGGMGAYCPTPLADDKLFNEVQRNIFVPVVDAMRRESMDFRGVLYAGLILTAGGPKVLEFNCRFGDPEVQPLLMRLKGDLLELMEATCTQTLDQVQIDWDERHACCVVMAAGGYPDAYEKGDPITGLDKASAMEDVQIFHAGTAVDKQNRPVTAGGRVLNVCALGQGLAEARDRANAACEAIHFNQAYYRRDIGNRVLQRV